MLEHGIKRSSLCSCVVLNAGTLSQLELDEICITFGGTIAPSRGIPSKDAEAFRVIGLDSCKTSTCRLLRRNMLLVF